MLSGACTKYSLIKRISHYWSFLRVYIGTPIVLHILNINDLPISIYTCDINIYADDTELDYCHSQLQQVDQVPHNKIGSW